MSRIQEALERYRQEVVEEARSSLDDLKAQADGSVDKALAKLDTLVDMWDKTAEQLMGFGLTSIADISMSGGAVWSFTTKVSSYQGGYTNMFDIIRNIDRDYVNPGSYSAPSIHIDKDKEYEFFIIIVPKEKGE